MNAGEGKGKSKGGRFRPATMKELAALGFIKGPYVNHMDRQNKSVHPKAQAPSPKALMSLSPNAQVVIPPSKALSLPPNAQVVIPPPKALMSLPPNAQVGLPPKEILHAKAQVSLPSEALNQPLNDNTSVIQQLIAAISTIATTAVDSQSKAVSISLNDLANLPGMTKRLFSAILEKIADSKASYKDILLQNIAITPHIVVPTPSLPPSLPPGLPPGFRLPPGRRLPPSLPPSLQRGLQLSLQASIQPSLLRLKEPLGIKTIVHQKSPLELVVSLGNAFNDVDEDVFGWEETRKYQESVSKPWKVNRFVVLSLCKLMCASALKRAKVRILKQAKESEELKQTNIAMRELSCSKKCMLSFITAWKEYIAMLPELRRLRDKKYNTKTPRNYQFTRKERNKLIRFKHVQEESEKIKAHKLKEKQEHTERIRKLEAKYRSKHDLSGFMPYGDLGLDSDFESDSDSDSEQDLIRVDSAGNTI